MEHLSHFLSKNCFSNLLKKQWNNLQYFWVDYTECIPKKTLSKYLLCPVSIDEWLTLHQGYDQFVADVIEPIYYALHNDICWNLYFVVIVSDNDFQKIDYHTRYNFEINTEYTRNLIIKDSQIYENLPVGNILMKADQSSFSYPINDWLKTLGDYFFMLETLSADDFRKLSSLCGVRHSNLPLPSEYPQHELIFAIESIHIPKEFRAHFYRKDLDIPCCKANLFVGSNGTGKTSILSAIELAMTGSVRKQKSDASDISDQTDVSVKLSLAGKCEEKSKPLSRDEKRQRAICWYNYASNCSVENLNSLFHCINYFSVDNAYRFVTSSAETNDILSKTILGPETLAVWGLLEKFRTLCRGKLSDLELWCLRLKKQLSQKSEFDENLENDLWNYIRRTGITINPKLSLQEVQSIIAEIEIELASVSEYMPFGSQYEVTQELEERIREFALLEEKAVSLAAEAESNKETHERLYRELQMAKEDYQNTKQLLNNLAPLKTMRGALSFAVMYSSEIAVIRSLRLAEEQLEPFYNKLYEYYRKFKKMSNLTSEPDFQCLNAKLLRLNNEKTCLERRQSQLLDQIATANKDFERKEKLTNQLCEIGSLLVENSSSLQKCPLCGTSNIPPKQILQHLQNTHSSSTPLWDLNEELLSVEKEIKRLKGRITKTQTNIQLNESLDCAYQTAIEDFSELLDINQPKLLVIQTVLKEYKIQSKKRKQMRDELIKLQHQLLENSANFTVQIDLDEVLSVEERLKELLQQNGYEIPPSCQGKDLQKQIYEIQDHLTSTAAKQRNIRSNLIFQLQQIASSEISAQRKKNYIEKDQLALEIKKLSAIKGFWERVSRWVGNDVNMGGKVLQAHCEKISSMAKTLIEGARIQQEKSYIEADIREARHQYNNCKAMLEKLDALKSPTKYSILYIKENMEHINQIFSCLHSPQEFSGLNVDETGELFGLRKGKEVSMNSMSAGQRTALVLSVFFQLHLSNAIAPRFLLIDEPVVNIDDLNILSLMDFLREMIVNHDRQIFITTSNRNVAQLFRRKFSFLGSDFQRLNFSRENDSNLKIMCQTYDQSRLINSFDLYE